MPWYIGIPLGIWFAWFMWFTWKKKDEYDRIEEMARLVDEDLVFKHRPFYLNFASGGRIWTRVYNNRDAIRGVNPDLIVYNDKDFPDE